MKIMYVRTSRSPGLAYSRHLYCGMSRRRLQRRCDTGLSFRLPCKRCLTINRATSIGDLALINVDYISPSLWLGVVLGITGMVLYSLKFRDARGTTEGDIVAASLFVMCGGILTLQGWRLDPILMLSEFVLGGVGIFYMVQTVNLRKKLELRDDVEQEASRQARWSLPRQQAYENYDDNYDQLPEGNGRDYRRTFQQRYQAQNFESEDNWTRDPSWPRTPGRSAVQDAPVTAQEDIWVDEYEVDLPYGVDTSSPKGRVSPETWQRKDS